MTKEQLEET